MMSASAGLPEYAVMRVPFGNRIVYPTSTEPQASATGLPDLRFTMMSASAGLPEYAAMRVPFSNRIWFTPPAPNRKRQRPVCRDLLIHDDVRFRGLAGVRRDARALRQPHRLPHQH